MADVDAVRAILQGAEAVAPMDLPDDAAEAGDDPGAADHGHPPPGGEGFGPPPPGGEASVAARCAGLPLNDHGNGQRFAAHFGDDVVFVPRVGPHVWDGRRWARDDDGLAVRARAQRLGPLILAEVPHLALNPATAPADPDAAAKLLAKVRQARAGHARVSGNSGRIDAMLTEAAVGLSCPIEALDVEPLAVNCLSGTLRFEVSEPGDGASRVASVRLDPHRRSDRITKLAQAAWTPGARAPRFEAFLARVQPDPAMRAFLQRWLGLSLSGVKAQLLCFWYGSGANGKSVLSDVIARLAGDYAATAKVESLIGENRRSAADATPDLVPLIGARFVRASEPEEGQRMQEARIKALTGGEPILVRALNSNFVEVTPIFKLTISGNQRPEVRGTDDGIWRRLLLVPWLVTIPPDERDPLLTEKLLAEADGILAWLADGLVDFLEGGLRPPAQVMAATEAYRAEQDPLGRFLAEAMAVTGLPQDTVPTADLVNLFAYWLIENGGSPWRPRTVQTALAAKEGVWRHPETGQTIARGKSSVSVYTGLRVTAAFRARFDAAPKDMQGRPLRRVADADGLGLGGEA